MSITPIIRPFFKGRVRAIERYAAHAEDIQRGALHRLLQQAADTQWGHRYQYASIHSYEEFAAKVPLNSYEELKGYIDQMRHGEPNVLWPGKVKWYAKSSGTTADKSKFIPVSPQGLKDTHYAGGTDAVALYLHNNPQSRIFDAYLLLKI